MREPGGTGNRSGAKGWRRGKAAGHREKFKQAQRGKQLWFCPRTVSDWLGEANGGDGGQSTPPPLPRASLNSSTPLVSLSAWGLHPPVLRGPTPAPPSGALLPLPACPLRQTHLMYILHSSHCVLLSGGEPSKGPSVPPEVSHPAALFTQPHWQLFGLEPVGCCRCVETGSRVQGGKESESFREAAQQLLGEPPKPNIITVQNYLPNFLNLSLISI